MRAPLARITTQNLRTGGEAQMGRAQGVFKLTAKGAAEEKRPNHPFEIPVKEKGGGYRLHNFKPQIGIATPTGVPFAKLAAIAGGAKLLSSATGLGGEEANRVLTEGVNVPTQVLSAVSQAGKAGIEAAAGKPQAVKEMAGEYAHHTAIGHLVTTGDVPGALKIAGEQPVGTGLEVWGLANAADSLAGRLHAPKMTDANVQGISRAPKELVPGGATKPQQPYAQAPIRNMFQRKAGARPLNSNVLSRALKAHFNRFQSDVLGVTRNTRERVLTHGIQRIKVGRGHINDGAIQPHGDFLAKPGIKNPATGQEFYHEQLERRIRELGPPDRFETPAQKQARETVRSHLIGLQDLPLKDRLKSYEAAMKVAAEKRATEPELRAANVFTQEEMENAKRAAAFQFHFGEHSPYYDPNYLAGQSPFHLESIEGPTISRAQVDRVLRENGVDPKQLSFTSARPYQSTTAPFRTGFRNAVGGSTKGRLSGMNFLHGQKDPSYEAVIRQELTDHQILNHARAQAVFNKNYFYNKEYIAKQIEQGLGKLSPTRRASAEAFIANHLRDGERHFTEKAGRSAKENGIVANEFLKEANPTHPDLVPVRATHMFAKNRERGTIATLEDLHEHLDPNKLYGDRESMLGEHAGPYGLVHKAVADQIRGFESYLNQYHPGSQLSSFWRRNNVAWSIRHIAPGGGVSQELLLRLLVNQAGPISYLQHTRMLRIIRDEIAKSNDPALKHALNVYEARMGVGSHAANTMLNERFTTPRDWQQLTEKLRIEKPVEWWQKGEARSITGAPLRAVKTIFKGYNTLTHEIMRLERKYMEHPLVEPLAGKVQAREFKALTGKRLKFVGAVDAVEKEFMLGRINPKAIDHTFNEYKEFAGDWQRSSVAAKKAMTYVPFWQWAANSLRFIYITMPLHHPMKTAALVALEHATEEARKAEGQEYTGLKSLFVGERGLLAPSQQGSIPVGAGQRYGAEYYSPAGAVSGGVEGALSFAFPYATGAWELAHGRNPVNGHELKESEQNQIAQLLALGALESALPPVRYAKQALEGRPAFGLRAPAITRPFRTEFTRKTKGVAPGRAKGVEAPEKPEKAEKPERPERPERPEKVGR